MQQRSNTSESIPTISPTYEGRPAVCTGFILCKICFTGCLKRNFKINKFEKLWKIKNQPTQHPSLTIYFTTVVKLMPINDAVPPCLTFLSWVKKIFNYINSFPGQVVHIVFDTYSYVDDLTRVLSNGTADKGIERKISNSDLNQLLPKSNQWQDFLTNEKNEFQICNLLADYFSSMISWAQKQFT